MKKRLLSIILTLALCLSLLPMSALAAGTVTEVKIDGVDANGNIIKYDQSGFSRTGPVLQTTDRTLSGQYYIVQESMTIDGNLTVDGSKNGGLVLCEGVTLTVTGALIHTGGNAFYIYGQSNAGQNAGRLVIKNSLDNTGAAIRSTTYARLGISRGELEIHGGQSGKLVEEVELYSTRPVHTATLNDTTKLLYQDWTNKTSITGNKLVIEYCKHDSADIVWINDNNTQHHWKCETCGFVSTAKYEHEFRPVERSAETHTMKCDLCGYEKIETHSYDTGSTELFPTLDGKGHSSKACKWCGYTSGNVAPHTYDNDGACSACGFEPIISDSEKNLYDKMDYADAFEAAAKGKVAWVQLESFVKDESDNYTNIVSRGFDFDYSGQSVRLKTNGKTLNTSDGTLLDVSAGTLIVEGEAKILETGTYNGSGSAINITGGSLIFENALTAQGGVDSNWQHPAIYATGGTLDMQGKVTLTGGLKLSGSAVLATKLKAGDVLNGGVSVGGSYNSVNELLGTGLAFATKSGETTTIVNGNVTSLSGNITVVEHTHSYTNNGACACGAVCPHDTIDDATGKCPTCNTTFAAAVNSTLYSDMTQAIAKWKNDGGTLKLYVSGGTVSFDNASTQKPFSIDLNGHNINKDQTAISLNGVNLTIEDSREKESSQGAFGAIVADSGSLTLENGGYLQGLKVTADSTATVMLKGGKVNALDCPKPVYTLLPDGYALMDGNLTVGPYGILKPGTQTYTIKNTQLKNITTTKSGNTTFGSQTIPFALSLRTDDSEIGKMSFKWYRIDRTTGTAVEIASFTTDETPVESVYTFNPDHVSISSDGWNDMTPGKYDVICVVAGKKSDGAYCWQTALTGYTLTVGKAGIADADVQVTNKTYNGNPQSPDVTVTLGGKTLVEGTDYTISGNSQTDAGNYTLKITGTGNYTGEKTANWSIAPKEVANAAVNVTNGPFTYNGTTIEPEVVVMDGTTVIPANEYTVSYDENINAGTATVTVTDKNGGNYTVNDSTTFAIGKAAAPTVQPGSMTVVNNLAKTYTVDLAALLPKLGENCAYGMVTYTLGHVDMSSYYTSGTAKIEEGKLILPINAVNSNKENKIDTVTVFVNSTNYAQFTLAIDVYATNKIIPTGTPTLSKDTLTYGEALSTITLSGNMNGVEGTFAWADGMVKPSAGEYTATWNFTPKDTETYQGTSGTVKITVNKATPTGEPKYTAITTSGKKLSDAGLTTEGGTFSGAGTVKWELPADTEVKANTAYKWVFTPTSGNYNAIEGSITLYSVSSSGSSSKPSYSVNTPGKTENGSVSLSTKNAVKGSTVTVTVQPESGYVLEKLVVTDKDGKQLAVTDLGGGKYSFVMPAGTVKVEASFQEQAKAPAFEDVSEGAYYYEAVQWAQEKGITDGISEDLFGPNQPCTRGQIVTFLWRAAGSPAPKGTSSFADVPAESYYAQAVAWAVENGITNGTGEGAFSPDASCDRSQSVTFLFRALGGETAGDAAFSDVPAGSYYASAVAWAAEQGITNGTSSTTFSPNEICTRGQIVTFLYRGYQGK